MRGSRRPFVLLFLLLAGWNEAGHSTVALVAHDRLPEATRRRVVALLAKHPAFESWGSRDSRVLFTRAASWPDEIRKEDHPDHADHRFEDHFINLPHGMPRAEEQSLAGVVARPNIVARLKQCVATLKDPLVEPPVRARELSWLFHLVGDIHQPLHCAGLISDRFPQGDRGGNWMLVATTPTEVKGEAGRLPNLHAFWDDLLGVDANLDAIQRTADGLPAPKGATTFDPEGWAWEGFRLAVRSAYADGLTVVATPEAMAALREGRRVTIPALPAGYAEKARDVARRQASLAGARLASLLIELFGS